jgi:hypothetical protein
MLGEDVLLGAAARAETAMRPAAASVTNVTVPIRMSGLMGSSFPSCLEGMPTRPPAKRGVTQS